MGALTPAHAEQARGDHLGIIEHQQITRREQLGQIENMLVTNLPTLAQQQSRRTARFDRARCDQRFGKIEIKIT